LVGKIRIREAELADLPILVAHRRAMFVAIGKFTPADLEEGDRTYRKWLRERLVAGAATAFIAETAAHKAVGSGAVFLREQDPVPGRGIARIPHIISMFTEESYRGQGIASMILEKLAGWARSTGCPIVTLSPGTKEVIKLYEKCGFQRGWQMTLRFNKPAPRPKRKPTR
jgi:GNAT superfamily N-acetyltransferase